MNRETKSSLRVINAFIVALGGFMLIGTIIVTRQIIKSPKAISIPVKLEVDLIDKGQLNYDNKTPINIDFKEVEAIMVYEENNPLNAPINWTEIGYVLIRMSLLLFVIFLTYKIMQTTLKNEPFSSINANRMRWIGYSFIFMGLLRFLINVWDLSILEQYLTSPHTDIENCYSIISIFEIFWKLLFTEILLGLLALFVAAIFKHGIDLREESKLTI